MRTNQSLNAHYSIIRVTISELPIPIILMMMTVILTIWTRNSLKPFSGNHKVYWSPVIVTGPQNLRIPNEGERWARKRWGLLFCFLDPFHCVVMACVVC